MKEALELIAVFHALNVPGDRRVAHLSPSLIGLFGSLNIFDAFLAELEAALTSGTIAEPLKKRAGNLAGNFIPQVAGFNSISALPTQQVTAEHLRSIRADSPGNRLQGVTMILAALMKILTEVGRLN